MTLTKQFTAQRSAGPNARIRATVAGQRTDTVRRAPVADEPRVSPRIIAAIQTTERNARTLWADGYTLEFVDPINLVYFVRRPEPQIDHRTGEIVREGYVVDLRAQTCECEMFERSLAATGRGTCKHLVGTDARIRAALAELGLGLPEPVATTPEPAPARIRWQVVEHCPTLGELPGLKFDTDQQAREWTVREEVSAQMSGEPIPHMSVRQVIWGVR